MLLNDKVIHSKSKKFKICNGYIMTEEDFERKKQALNNLKPTKVLHQVLVNKSDKKGKQNNEFRKKSKKK